MHPRLLPLAALPLLACTRTPAPSAATPCPAPVADTVVAARTCRVVAERFAALLDTTMPAGRIERGAGRPFIGTTGPHGWTMRVPADDSTLRRVTGQVSVEGAWMDIIAHEVGHQVLATYAMRADWAASAGQYATPLPDWIDESVAIWMEPERKRRYRARQATEQAMPTLASIAARRHPNAGTRGDVVHEEVLTIGPCPRCSGPQRDQKHTVVIRTRDYSDGRTTVDTTIIPPGTPVPGDTVTPFYGRSLLVAEWVHARGGPPAMREVIRRAGALPAGSAGSWRDFAGAPGLPADSAALERDWTRWLAERP